MKKLIILLGVFTVLQLLRADTIAKWTFETSKPGAFKSAGNWFTNITAEVGVGTASALHGSSTIYSSTPGNGSFASFGATNGWSVGDFYQFVVNTVGFNNISISFDQTGTATGPSIFFLEYSNDGNTFTKFGSDYTLKLGNWNSSTANITNSFNFDLSSISSIINQSTVYFRIVDDSTVAINGGVVSGYQDDRVDNVLISAQPVPEPASMALLVSGIACCVFIIRRKQSVN
jgi:hypothetical protein